MQPDFAYAEECGRDYGFRVPQLDETFEHYFQDLLAHCAKQRNEDAQRFSVETNG